MPTSARSGRPTLYVVTAYHFNHVERPMPIDGRFFDPRLQSIFYFVDNDGAPRDFRGDYLNEIDLNPRISAVGRSHLGEWTFLLTEHEKPFARYPFFVVSSRLPEKNARLPSGLGPHWRSAIKALRCYGWGYLPSYDRDPGFEDLVEYRKKGLLAMSEPGLEIVERFYGVRFPTVYRYFSDFFCNYIGFASRRHLERYIEFYLPFLRFFFDADYNVVIDGNEFCRRLHTYRNEKPFTFLLEMISHLFFYTSQLPFAGLSYNGIYEVNEREAVMRRLSRLDLVPFLRRVAPARAAPERLFIRAPRLRGSPPAAPEAPSTDR